VIVNNNMQAAANSMKRATTRTAGGGSLYSGRLLRDGDEGPASGAAEDSTAGTAAAAEFAIGSGFVASDVFYMRVVFFERKKKTPHAT
jgi:hypothetical protein